MDTLKNRKASRAARDQNGGEQVPTKTTQPKRGEDDQTRYVSTAKTFVDQLKNSVAMDEKTAAEDVDRQRAERLQSAIHAPRKTDKQEQTAEQDAKTAATSTVGAESAQRQSQQASAQQQGGNGGAGWTSGGAGTATQAAEAAKGTKATK